MLMQFQYLVEEKRKENLNKKIDCFINYIFYNQTLSKLTLKEAKENILTLKTKFKTAQEEGTLSPEETKDLSMEILDLVGEVAEIASDITEGVPAENGDGGNDEIISDDTVIEEGGDHGLNERINQGQEDEDDEKLELKDKIAKLNTTVATMQKEAKQERRE